MAESAEGRIIRYLQEAIAAEHSFESRLKEFAKTTGNDDPACALFTKHAQEVRVRLEQLTRRVHSLGAEPSVLQGFFAEVFRSGPHIARGAQDANEHLLQNLTVAYTNAQAEQVLLLVLSSSAAIAGDPTTSTLAKDLQQQAKTAADEFWDAVEPATQTSTGTMPYVSSSDVPRAV